MKLRSVCQWSAIAAIAVACGAGYLAYDRSPPPGRAPRPLKTASDGHGRRALLVGCGQYTNPSIRRLEGPINDVRLMKDVLIERCGFSAADITILSGEPGSGDAPTRARIEGEFRRLRDEAQDDDQIVVLLAGHGSQQPNQAGDLEDSEPDGLDEIFLPIDVQQWSSEGSNSGVVNAIIDDEIHRWTTEIAERGAAIWVVFDCCCAGTAIRGEYQEVPRFVSATDDLRVPEASLERGGHGRAAARSRETSYWIPSASDRVVAFYACQANESEVELNLPPAKVGAVVERAKHGLLTYALCCALSQPGNEAITYGDLARDVWLRYRTWGRAAPTPFADGALDREVLGQRQGKRRFRVVRRNGREGVLDAGALHGLAPGSIVGLYPPVAVDAAASDWPAGYARVTRVQPTTSRIVSCSYGDVKPIGFDVGTTCEPVYAHFGDMRLSVAVDEQSASRDEPAAAVLAQLADELRSLAGSPTSVFTFVDDVSAADWVVQARSSIIELLPRSAAELAEGEPLPLGTPRFKIDQADSSEAIAALLHRVFRSQNLVKLASGFNDSLAPGRAALKLKVELLSESGLPLADQGELAPGQKVEWRVTNTGTVAFDLTLLFIDSKWTIAPAYPLAGELEDIRLAPGDNRSCSARVTAKTLGTEYLVAIAARARGPQRDFRCLAEPSLDDAQDLAAGVRGGENAFQSPFGRLLQYALYNDEPSPGTSRGLTSADADDCRLAIRAWIVKPK